MLTVSIVSSRQAYVSAYVPRFMLPKVLNVSENLPSHCVYFIFHELALGLGLSGAGAGNAWA
jgi:hypothetical protein